MAVPGKRVCHIHGGAPGSGAPKGNQNARKHGLDSRRFRRGVRKSKSDGGGALREPQGTPADTPDVLDRPQELLVLEGLGEEIATYRVLIRDAIRDKRDLTTIARGLDTLARLVRAEYAVSEKSKDTLSRAITETMTLLGESFGLKDFLEEPPFEGLRTQLFEGLRTQKEVTDEPTVE